MSNSLFLALFSNETLREGVLGGSFNILSSYRIDIRHEQCLRWATPTLLVAFARYRLLFNYVKKLALNSKKLIFYSLPIALALRFSARRFANANANAHHAKKFRNQIGFINIKLTSFLLTYKSIID